MRREYMLTTRESKDTRRSPGRTDRRERDNVEERNAQVATIINRIRRHHHEPETASVGRASDSHPSRNMTCAGTIPGEDRGLTEARHGTSPIAVALFATAIVRAATDVAAALCQRFTLTSVLLLT